MQASGPYLCLTAQFAQVVTLTPGRSGSFTITAPVAALPVGNRVRVQLTSGAIPSRGNARDEGEMDSITASGYVVDATTIRVYWNASGWVVGDYEFSFHVEE